jgi:gluconolactonase
MDIELVTEGLAFPEGPMAMNDGSVILTEMELGALTRVTPDGKKERVADCGGMTNGAAIGPDGAIWVANNGGAFTMTKNNGLNFPGATPDSHKGGMIQRVDMNPGKVETIYDACDGRRLVAPNDLVFDKQGGIWFTDHGCGIPDGRKYGALCYATTDGSKISRQRDHFISPNGVGLSPDEKTVYMADTNIGRLWAFDIAEPGVLAASAGFGPGRNVATMPGYQLFDSLAVEADGRVCVATILNGGITAIDPSDGAFEHFPFPDLITTNICFGGADMRDAWVTCSTTGKLFKCRWPRPGLKLNFNA